MINTLDVSGENFEKIQAFETSALDKHQLRLAGDIDVFGRDNQKLLDVVDTQLGNEAKYDDSVLDLSPRRISIVDSTGSELATMTFNVFAPAVK